MNINMKTLSEKAMLVRLTRSAPPTSKRNQQAESLLEGLLGDDANVVSTKLFKNPDNAVRRLLNLYGHKYRHHTRLSLPHEDRGARLLPVTAYDAYIKAQRAIDADIERLQPIVLQNYHKWVQTDLDERTARATVRGIQSTASLADYPTQQDFEQRLSASIKFSTLPDARHPLFDSSDAELAEVQEQMKQEIDALEQEITRRVSDDLKGRMQKPLKHLIEKLKLPIGEEGHIFRDTAITNIADACDEVKALCMGDPDLLGAAEELRAAVTPLRVAPHVVRESPVVRAAACKRLQDVAEKMGFMFGG